MNATRTFKWSTIEQPGEYFTLPGDGMLYEDCGGMTRVWRIHGETADGRGLVVSHVRYDIPD